MLEFGLSVHTTILHSISPRWVEMSRRGEITGYAVEPTRRYLGLNDVDRDEASQYVNIEYTEAELKV